MRPIVEVTLNGKKLNAVLNTGSRRSYILKKYAKNFPRVEVEPFEALIGGRRLKFKEARFIHGIIKDTSGRSYKFAEKMFEIEDLGEENGKKIDLLFGAITLEDWGTVIDENKMPPEVDFKLLRKGKLVEL